MSEAPRPGYGEIERRRGGGDAMETVSMDPAHQSLVGALRNIYALLLVVMIGLAVVFVLTGVKRIDEQERGVKLLFGRIVDENVAPGSTFVAPFPIGEVESLPIGQQSTTLYTSFGPARQGGRSLSDARPTSVSLRPDEHGSLLTGDVAIAHAWWTALWRREDPSANIRNLSREDEIEIVRAAVERGVVLACAETTVEALLKQSAGEEGQTALALRVRDLTQSMLNDLGAGIRVDRVILEDKTPPARTDQAFQAVTSAESRAAQRREEANKEAREILNAVAAEAHRPLITLIDRYEAAIELERVEEGERLLATIDRLLEGEPVEVDGRIYTAAGEVTSIMSEAKQYRTDVVARARTRADEFEAKLANFRASPRFFVASQWRPAYEVFREFSGVETFVVPPNADLQVVLNRDPDIAREAEAARNIEEARSTFAEREAELRRTQRQRQRAERIRERQERQNR